MTSTTLTPAPDAYFVVAEVIHGPHATPVVGKGLYCSIECASAGVRELTDSIGENEQGSAFVLRYRGRPVGCAVTRGGRIWMVQILGSRELPAL
jgi:hypothetical protein